jgi:hypothetical protein
MSGGSGREAELAALEAAINAAENQAQAAQNAYDARFNHVNFLDSWREAEAEQAYQANKIRAVYWHNQRYSIQARIQRQAARNAIEALEAAQQQIAKRAQIQKAIDQAAKSAQTFASAMTSQEPAVQTMPRWVSLGIMAAGAVVVVAVGWEALAAAGIAGAAETIIGIAEVTDITTVAVTGAEGAETAAFFARLRAAGLTVTTVAPAIIEKVFGK